jgi:hypothetical protein
VNWTFLKWMEILHINMAKPTSLHCRWLISLMETAILLLLSIRTTENVASSPHPFYRLLIDWMHLFKRMLCKCFEILGNIFEHYLIEYCAVSTKKFYFPL